MKQENPTFEKILFQAAYEGMNVIGNSVPSAIIPYLEKTGSIESSGVIANFEAFDKDLKKIFGFGAKIIEKKILEILCSKLQISQKLDNDFNFDDVIKDIKRKFHSKEVQVTLAETVNV